MTFNVAQDGIVYALSAEESGRAMVTGISDETASTIVIPNTITVNEVVYTISAITTGAFQNCTSLTSLSVPFVGNGLGQTYLGSVFGATAYTENATSVPANLTNLTITNATKINNYALYGVSQITNMSLPSSVTAIGQYAFFNCAGLTTIQLSHCENMTTIDLGAFQACSGLTSISLPFVGKS